MINQIWFDSTQSLAKKYLFAVNSKLRGVGMWNVDQLDYSNTPQANTQRKQMWDTLPDYIEQYVQPTHSRRENIV